MSNDLANISNHELGVSDEDFQTFVASSSKYLPRVQLFTSSTNPVKRKEFPVDHWGLVIRANEIEDLGEEIIVVPIDLRLKAIDMNTSPPEVSFDPKSEEYQDIKSIADSKPKSGCMYGPEFLVWLPDQKRFALLMFGSPTARNEAPRLYAILKEKGTAELGSRIIEKGELVWTGPEVTRYSLPVSSLPNPDRYGEVLKNFKNRDVPAEEEPALEVENPAPGRDR